MGLSKMAVKRPVATGTLLILVLLIGLVSLYQSPLDLLPDIQAPILAIITPFPGSSPQETLELVSRPIEEGVSAVSGLTGLNSISQESLSLVILVFDWGADVKRLREDINVRMDLISFPDEVQRPIILEFDPTLMPIMQLSASGSDDPVLLTEWLEEIASPRLESIRGVASVQVQGGAKQDVFVRTFPDTMAEYEVSFEQIANVLRASLTDLPAGIIDLEDRQVRIRFLGRYAQSDMLSDLVVGFQVDQEALEELVGQSVDINLNQVLSGQANLLSGGGTPVPIRDIYWNDFFDLDNIFIAGRNIFLPINREWLDQNGGNVENSLFIFTANPDVSYDPVSHHLVLDLHAIGRLPLPVDGNLQSEDPLRLEDIWNLGQAVWLGDFARIPLDRSLMDIYNVTQAELNSMADLHPLITRVEPDSIIVSFHEDWASMRNEPLASLPDYSAWLSNVQREVDRGLASASRELEDGLAELATTMILSSMSPGGGSFAGIEFEDDFPINPISLGMIAEIEQDTYNPSTITRYNQQPSINLVIQKEGDANTVLVAREVRQVLDELSAGSVNNFSQVTFNTIFDQAEEIERALADLAEALLGGAALAILVLLVFLRNWRTTMFIGLSIPAAIIVTFTLLYFANITINLMTLGGLALAAGMLVDNAIVVSENIFRRYQMGENPEEAAVNGAQEVAGAITASTLTTISVFFPVVFLSGLAGQLFWEFALTVACAILASLVVALTVIPLLASRSLDRKNERSKKRVKPHRLPGYRKMLHTAVSNPWWVIIFAAIFIGLGALSLSTLGTELFPNPDESAFSIEATLTPGTTLSNSDNYARSVEDILSGKDGILSYSTRVGGGGFMGVPSGTGSSNQVRVRAEVDPQRVREIDQIIEDVRGEVSNLPFEAEVTINRESLLDAAGLETSLDLVISGDDLEQIIRITEEAAIVLQDYPGFTDVQSSLEENRPEVHVRLDQGEALQKGVTLIQVATAVRQALEGIPVSRIETDAGVLSVVLGYQKTDIRTMDDLGKIGFYTPSGEYLQLDQVAELSEAFGPQSIPRENQRIVGQIQLQYGDMDLGTATDEALAVLEERITLPPGYEIKTAGSSNLMGDVMSELQLVILMAALLVYLVMAAQFESLLHPFIIVLSLPLAYAGSVMALALTGNSISIPAMIGIVVLSGILVNDGIIMVDFINQQRRFHGLPLKEAIIEGAAARLRPIMMTTATTVLGLLPLAFGFGEGAQIQAPMAITIIGGQITGTLLLLLAIPSAYVVLTREKKVVDDTSLFFENGRQNAVAVGGENIPVQGQKAGRVNKTPGYTSRNIIVAVVRMVIVLILAGIILYLLGYSGTGQDLLTVIR